MEHRYITYKEFKTEGFRKFTMDLKVDMFQLINNECQEYKEILGKKTYKKLQGAFNPFFNYYSTLEKVHSLVSKGLMKYEHLRDAVLIDEMAVYTLNNLDEDRILIDILTLLILRGQSYFQLGCNELVYQDSNPLRSEYATQFIRGLRTTFSGRVMSSFADSVKSERDKEIIKVRLMCLKNIQAVIMLYFYSLYISLKNIRLFTVLFYGYMK